MKAPHQSFVSRETNHLWLPAPTRSMFSSVRNLVPQLMCWTKTVLGQVGDYPLGTDCKPGSRHCRVQRALGWESMTWGLILSASALLWALPSLALKGRSGPDEFWPQGFIQQEDKLSQSVNSWSVGITASGWCPSPARAQHQLPGKKAWQVLSSLQVTYLCAILWVPPNKPL